MKKGYRVEWVIELDADSPKYAAREALEIQHDSGNEAVFFTVTNIETGKKTDVDLLLD